MGCHSGRVNVELLEVFGHQLLCGYLLGRQLTAAGAQGRGYAQVTSTNGMDSTWRTDSRLESYLASALRFFKRLECLDGTEKQITFGQIVFSYVHPHCIMC